MPTVEEVLMSIRAVDNASTVIDGVDKKVQTMSSNFVSSVSKMNTGLMGISNSFNSMLGSITKGKTPGELIFGTSSKAETNKVLLKMMSDTSDQAKVLEKHVDDITNTSLVSMQSLIPAMNAFKTATGATDQQIYNATEGISNFGAKVLAQTGSVDLAEQAMMDLSKGIKGACASLDQYGITTDALKATGKWSGDEKDIEGYIAAVVELTGDTKELMETNEGLDALLGKQFSAAGKKIGNEFLPQIKDVKRAYLDLDKSLGGNLSAGLLVGLEGLSISSSFFQQISLVSNGIKDISSAIKDAKNLAGQLKDAIKGVGDAAKTAGDTAQAAVATAQPSVEAVQEASSFADFGGAMLPEEILELNKKNNYDDYVKAIKDNNKGLKNVEKAFAEGKIDEAAYKKISASMKNDREILKSTFMDMGEIADIPMDKYDSKNFTKYIKSIEEEDKKISDALNLLDEGGLSIVDADSKVKESKKRKEDLVEELISLNDVDIDIDAKKGKTATKIAEEADDIKDLAKKTDEVVDGATDIAEAGAGLGAAGGEAAVAAEGAATFSGAFAGFGASLGAMLAPLLMVSVVIAIMIPIVAALVVEILIFVKAIMEVMAALQFDSVDLSGAIEGLKSFAQAMWELTSAVAAITVTTLLASIGNAISFFSGGLVGSIKQLIDQIKEIAPLLKQLESIDVPGEAIGNKMASLSKTLDAVNSAVKSLAGIAWSEITGNLMTLGGRLGNFQSLLESALNDIKAANTTLGNLSSLDISAIENNGVADKMTKIAEALKPVAEAIKSLRGITDAQTTWNPLTNFVESLDSAKKDLTEASKKLGEFNGLADPGDTVGPKITKIADALKPVAEAINSLKGIDDAQSTWNPMTNFIKSLDSAKKDIEDASQKLKEFNSANIFDPGDTVGPKITRVANALKPIREALNQLKSIGDIEYNSEGKISSMIDNAKEDLINTSKALEGLKDIPDVPEGLGGKIKRLADVLKPIKTAIETINVTTIEEFTNDTLLTNLKSSIPKLKEIADALQPLGEMGDVGDASGKISNISSAISTASNAITTFNGTSIPEFTNDGLVTNLQNAIAKITELAGYLNGLNGIEAPTAGSNLIPQMNTTLDSIRNMINSLNEGGMPTLNIATVNTAVQNVKDIAASLNTLNGTTIEVTSVITAINDALTQIKTTLQNATGFTEAGTNIGAAITSGLQSGLGGLSGAITGPLNTAVGDATSVATSGGQTMGTSMTSALQQNLTLGDVMAAEMDYVRQAVDNGIAAAKTAAQNGAADIVQAFRDGMNSNSPGDIAWTMHDEMWYTIGFMESEGKHILNAAKTLGQKIVKAFGNPTLSIGTDWSSLANKPSLSADAMINAGALTNNATQTNNQNGGVTIINIGEGAVQLDARNLTTAESKQVMINALEGLDIVRNVNIRGM